MMCSGDMFLEREIQSSRYNLVEADVAVQRQLYELHRQEATRLAKAQVQVTSFSFAASHFLTARLDTWLREP